MINLDESIKKEIKACENDHTKALDILENFIKNKGGRWSDLDQESANFIMSHFITDNVNATSTNPKHAERLNDIIEKLFQNQNEASQSNKRPKLQNEYSSIVDINDVLGLGGENNSSANADVLQNYLNTLMNNDDAESKDANNPSVKKQMLVLEEYLQDTIKTLSDEENFDLVMEMIEEFLNNFNSTTFDLEGETRWFLQEHLMKIANNANYFKRASSQFIKIYSDTVLKNEQESRILKINDFMQRTLDGWIRAHGWTVEFCDLILSIVRISSELFLRKTEDEGADFDKGLQLCVNNIQHIGFWMAKNIPAELLNKVFEFCKSEIDNYIQDELLFPPVFLEAIYADYPEEFERYFQNPALFIDQEFLFRIGGRNTQHYEWTLIGLYVVKSLGHDPSIQNEIDYVLIEIDDVNAADGLYKALKKQVDQLKESTLKWIETRIQENKNIRKSIGNIVLSKKVNHHQPPIQKNKNPNKNTCTPVWDNSTKQQCFVAQHENISIEFTEKIVPGDGNCAFHATGFRRETLYETLLSQKNNVDLRRKFVEEIKEYTYSFYIRSVGCSSYNDLVNSDPFCSFYHSIENLQIKIDALHRNIINVHPELAAAKKNLTNAFSEFSESEEKTLWKKLSTELEDLNEKLDTFLLSESIFERYINQSKGDKHWCSMVALIEYARLNNINLCIWKKKDSKQNILIKDRAHGDITAPNTMHLYFTGDHFNRLTLKNSSSPVAGPNLQMGQKF